MNVFDLIVQHGSVRQIQLVLENGINIDIRNKFKETLPMVCVRDVFDAKRRAALLKSLNKFNPNYNLQDANGQTVFIYACIYEQEDTLTFLLQKPTLDVNMADDEGFTGFMRACDNGCKGVVKLLVDAHVNGQICLELDKVNNKGMTALKLAIGKHFGKLFGLVNGVYSNKNYAKPKLCVPESQESELRVKVAKNNKPSDSQQGGVKSKKTLNITEIKKALKEACLSDDEDDNENGNGNNELSEMVKALKECSTDIRQIYTEQEQRDRKYQEELKKYHKGHKGKHSNKEKGKGARVRDVKLETQPAADRDKIVQQQISFVKNKQIVTLDVPIPRRKARSSNAFQHPPPSGINIEGLKYTPQQSEERKIVLSDTSNYDSKQAITRRGSKDDMLYRRVRGTNMSTLPRTINGRPNHFGIKLPNRKVWTSMEPGEMDYHPPPGPPMLPPLRNGFRPREQNSPVKHLDRDMWKIVESYRS